MSKCALVFNNIAIIVYKYTICKYFNYYSCFNLYKYLCLCKLKQKNMAILKRRKLSFNLSWVARKMGVLPYIPNKISLRQGESYSMYFKSYADALEEVAKEAQAEAQAVRELLEEN